MKEEQPAPSHSNVIWKQLHRRIMSAAKKRYQNLENTNDVQDTIVDADDGDEQSSEENYHDPVYLTHFSKCGRCVIFMVSLYY